MALAVTLLVTIHPALAAGRPRRAAQMGSWSDVSPATGSGQVPGRRQHALVADRVGNAYLFGGVGANGDRLNDLWRLSVATGRWQEVLPADGVRPPPIEEPHLVVDQNGDLYSFGGRLDDVTLTNAVWRFRQDEQRWTDLSASAIAAGVPAREDHGWALDPVGRRAYVFAGGAQDGSFLNDFWRYDLATDTWANLTLSSGSGAIAPREIYNITYDYQGHLLLFGGTGSDAESYAIRYQDFWRYDLASGRWQDISSTGSTAVPGRHYYGQAADPYGNFYVLGGWLTPSRDSPPSFVAGDFWMYDAATSSWAQLPSPAGLMPRIPYAMAYLSRSASLVVFGGADLSGLFGDTWMLPLAVAPPPAPDTPTPSAAPSSSATPSPGETPSPTGMPSFSPTASSSPTWSPTVAQPADTSVPSGPMTSASPIGEPTSPADADPARGTPTSTATSAPLSITPTVPPSSATASPTATPTRSPVASSPSPSATATRTATPTVAATATPTFVPVTTVVPSDLSVTVQADNGRLRLDLPAGIAQVGGQAVAPQLEVQAAPLPARSLELAGGIGAVKIEMRAPTGAPITQLSRPMTIELQYTDADLRAAGLREADLRIYYSRDGVSWTALPTQIDRAAKRAIAVVDHLTIFALAQPLVRVPDRIYIPVVQQQLPAARR